MHQILSVIKIATAFSKHDLDLSLLDNQGIIDFASKFIKNEPFLDVFVAKKKNGKLEFENLDILLFSLIAIDDIDVDIYIDLNEMVVVNTPNDYTIPLSKALSSKYAFKFKDEINSFFTDKSLIEKLLQNYENVGNLILSKNIFAYI